MIALLAWMMAALGVGCAFVFAELRANDVLVSHTGGGLTTRQISTLGQHDLFAALRYAVKSVPGRLRNLVRKSDYPDVEATRQLAVALLPAALAVLCAPLIYTCLAPGGPFSPATLAFLSATMFISLINLLNGLASTGRRRMLGFTGAFSGVAVIAFWYLFFVASC